MEITQEIEQIFATRAETITGIEITYRNGGKVIGTIRKLRLAPLRMVVQKTVIEKRERPRHNVVFDHVSRMQLSFEDGTAKVFE
jgi:hypothetical protein